MMMFQMRIRTYQGNRGRLQFQARGGCRTGNRDDRKFSIYEIGGSQREASWKSRITTNFRAGEMRNGRRGGMERVGRTNDVEKTVTTLVVGQRKELDVKVRRDDTEEEKITCTGQGLQGS